MTEYFTTERSNFCAVQRHVSQPARQNEKENEEELEKGDICQLQSAVYEIHSLTIHISGLLSEQVSHCSHQDSRPRFCPHKVRQSQAVQDVWE